MNNKEENSASVGKITTYHTTVYTDIMHKTAAMKQDDSQQDITMDLKTRYEYMSISLEGYVWNRIKPNWFRHHIQSITLHAEHKGCHTVQCFRTQFVQTQHLLTFQN